MESEDIVSSDRSPANSARVLALSLAATTGMTGSASDWRQFRGPKGSGIAPADAQPAITWSDSQNVKWNLALAVPGSCSPVVAGGRVFVTCYFGYGDGAGGGSLESKSGGVIYRERLPDLSGAKPFYTSVVAANGHLYAVSRRNGTFVLEAKPEFILVARNKLAGDDSDFNATPAIAGRHLFLRSNRTLYCIESAQTEGAGKPN